MKTIDSIPSSDNLSINTKKEMTTMTKNNSTMESEAIPDFPKLPPEVTFPKSYTDGVCPWIDNVNDFFRKWSPISFEGYFTVAALFLLAAVANGRVEFDFGGHQSTNVYSLLIGRTTLHAKTTLTKLVKKIIKALGMQHSLPDTVTSAKMLSMMAMSPPDGFEKLSEENKIMVLEKLKYPGQRYWISNEFGEIIEELMNTNSVNARLRSILRGFDDHEDIYENGTIIRDVEVVKNPYLCILGCCTLDDFAPYARKGTKLWGDGFLARFTLVAPPAKEIIRGRFPQEDFQIPEEILSPLRAWNAKLGIPEVTLSPKYCRVPAKGQLMRLDQETIDAFYNYHDALIPLVIDANDDMTGNYGRFATKTLRYAVLMASLDGCESVSIRYWAKAQMIVEEHRESFHFLYYQLTAGKYRKPMSIEDKIIAVINKDGKINSREFRQNNKGLLIDDVDPVFNRLLEEGTIRQIEIGKGIWYVFSNNGT